MKSGDTRKQDEIGVRVVSQITTELFDSGWQEMDHTNDNGIDSIIILRKNGKTTGRLIFTQIKCGSEYRKDTKKRPNHFGVLVGEEYISKHVPRWQKMPGPVILVYVDPSTDPKLPHAWWVDLRSAAAYSSDNKNVILVPKDQRFFSHSQGLLMRLCGSAPSDRDLPNIYVTRSECGFGRFSETTKKSARTFYQTWAAVQALERTNPTLGEIRVTRIGWRHMSANSRKPERVLQSWLLLRVAKRMVKEITDNRRIGAAKIALNMDGSKTVVDYLTLRANVHFPHRDSSIIQVVLRRKRIIGDIAERIEANIQFLSVYELRRGKK